MQKWSERATTQVFGWLACEPRREPPPWRELRCRCSPSRFNWRYCSISTISRPHLLPVRPSYCPGLTTDTSSRSFTGTSVCATVLLSRVSPARSSLGLSSPPACAHSSFRARRAGKGQEGSSCSPGSRAATRTKRRQATRKRSRSPRPFTMKMAGAKHAASSSQASRERGKKRRGMSAF